MKRAVLHYLMVNLVISLSAQRSDTLIVSDIFSTDSLIHLFPNGAVKDKVIEWKPSAGEKVLYKDVISKAGYCYTQFRHVINLEYRDYYVFLRTDRYLPGEFDLKENYRPLVGFVHFRRSGNGYKLVKMRCNVVSLQDAYDDGYMRLSELKVPSVMYERAMRGPGEAGTIVDYYDLDSFTRLFSVITFQSNESKVEIGSPGYFERTNSVSSLDSNTVQIYTSVTKVDPKGNIKDESSSRKVKIYDDKRRPVANGVFK